MRTNGIIEFRLPLGGKPGEYIDEYGNPIECQRQWSCPLPCLVSTVSQLFTKPYDDGTYRQASYNILMEESIFPRVPVREVRLYLLGEQVGEYEILECEFLPSVGRVRMRV